jgi:hypothetical protein
VLKFWNWKPWTWPPRLKRKLWDSWSVERAAVLNAARVPTLIAVAPLVVVTTTAALATAVLVPEKAPEWLRDWMFLGAGDETAATPWVRWALLVVAVALLLFARNWGQTAWPDVALLLVAFLAGFAAYKQHHAAEKATPTETPATAAFTLMTGATAVSNLEAGSKTIVFLVEAEKTANNKPISYTSKRYKATLDDAVSAGKTTTDVAVDIERGADDATAVAFSADLVGATRIYLLPGP